MKQERAKSELRLQKPPNGNVILGLMGFKLLGDYKVITIANL